jgi:holo-[acyl-carrier protein] synthase
MTMIFGIGTDLLEVARMTRELALQGGGFRDQVFSPAEIAYCQAKRFPERHYAARFAAKEALLKALGNAGPGGFYWRDIEIQHSPAGQPCLVLTGRLLSIARNAGVRNILVSLAHTPALAAATVLLET